MTVTILVNKLDHCFVVHLLEPAIKRCFTGDLCSLGMKMKLEKLENEFLDKLIKEGKRKLARGFNLSYCYIDDLKNNYGDLCSLPIKVG